MLLYCNDRVIYKSNEDTFDSNSHTHVFVKDKCKHGPFTSESLHTLKIYIQKEESTKVMLHYTMTAERYKKKKSVAMNYNNMI